MLKLTRFVSLFVFLLVAVLFSLALSGALTGASYAGQAAVRDEISGSGFKLIFDSTPIANMTFQLSSQASWGDFRAALSDHRVYCG
jgi:hypothetical protein